MKNRTPFIILAACLFLAFPSAAFAQTVKSPIVDKGEFEFDLDGRYQHDRAPARNGEREFSPEIGYGFTQHFKAKLELEFKEKTTTGFYYERFKIHTIYNFVTEKEGAFADVGFYGDVGIADRTDSTHEYTAGLTARKKFFDDKITSTANLFIKQDFGDTAANGFHFIYRGQSKYALSKGFEPGFEILGDSRKKEAFRDQSLRIGPMAYGKFALGDAGRSIGYEVGYLVGVTPATPDGTLKWKLKYEMVF